MTQSVAPFSISRVLNAPRDLVFKVHTHAEHLQKWMSPEGFKAIHASMDFRVGGTYHYGLEGPNGMQMWGKQVFREIVPNERLTYIQSFSDKDGGNTRHPMSQTWPLEMLATTTFEDIDEASTKVTITWQPRPELNGDMCHCSTMSSSILPAWRTCRQILVACCRVRRQK